MKRQLRVKIRRAVMPRKFSPFEIELEETMEVDDKNREKVRKRTVKELKAHIDRVCEKELEDAGSTGDDDE